MELEYINYSSENPIEQEKPVVAKPALPTRIPRNWTRYQLAKFIETISPHKWDEYHEIEKRRQDAAQREIDNSVKRLSKNH